jgi:acyl transferase domain-containing protein
MNNPSDYKEDSQGRLVPIATITAVDLERDDLVISLVRRAIEVREILRAFRAQAFADIQAFAELSAEKYGAKIGGVKGNITLVSFDGRYKIQRAMSEQLVFDERLQAAKKLIDECLQEWSKDAGKELRALVSDAFQVDKEGAVNTGRVLSLRRMNFDHPKWTAAMSAIADSLRVAASRTYLRLYERADSGQYLPISLDLANV